MNAIVLRLAPRTSVVLCGLPLLVACGQPEMEASSPVADRAQALSGTGEPAGVPSELRVPTTETLKLHAHAIGVQIYTCVATATGYGFSFKAPEANLYDEKGRYIGNHFLGPTWQYKDGSKITGSVAARAASPSGSIAWLLLNATSAGLPGKLSDVTHIQRLFTYGGVIPQSGCDAAHVGQDTRVDYTAEYYFYHPRDSHDDND